MVHKNEFHTSNIFRISSPRTFKKFACCCQIDFEFQIKKQVDGKPDFGRLYTASGGKNAVEKALTLDKV